MNEYYQEDKAFSPKRDHKWVHAAQPGFRQHRCKGVLQRLNTISTLARGDAKAGSSFRRLWSSFGHGTSVPCRAPVPSVFRPGSRASEGPFPRQAPIDAPTVSLRPRQTAPNRSRLARANEE
ncbi:hypothetical protein HPB47_026719 [Ixodes persulcatus]|uniref:Uncharacterized protein n=1 Tax=Ixodes persulcatus TaxID=34615 RepID=A0AC60PY12_IXOPE|nr:hypothetical protein HPB47_026719 [Ixodes persulcatus]